MAIDMNHPWLLAASDAVRGGAGFQGSTTAAGKPQIIATRGIAGAVGATEIVATGVLSANAASLPTD
jgi:hypothetical protein